MTTSKIRNAIVEIAQANGGTVTPEQVVSAARDPNSPLHKSFDWNDASAADKFRLDQARALIARCKIQITIHDVEHKVPLFYRNENVAAKEQGYVETRQVLSNKDLLRRTIHTAATVAKGFLARQEVLTAATSLKLRREIDAAVEALATLEQATAPENAETPTR